MPFLQELNVTPTGERAPSSDGLGNLIYELGQELTYQPRRGAAITAPAGYRTDLASIPAQYQQRDPLTAPAARPGVIHDYLYTSHERPRWVADRIFRHALRDEGVPLGQRLAMWAAVRAFGGPAYRARLGWAPPGGGA